MSAPIVTFRKGPKRPVTSRRRSATPPADTNADAGPSTSVIRPSKKNIANPLVQGSKRRRDFDADADGDSGGGLDDLDYVADESLTTKGDAYVTRGNVYDTSVYGEFAETGDKGKRVRLNEDGEIDVDDGLYRGLSGYLPTINKTRETLDSKMKTGPIRATASVRTITLVDYQPDVCKDYKETGFCGYGDSCKFMHDRGDYLAGWQLDKLEPDGGAPVQEEEEEEEVPFACLICRKEFTEPVVTKCGHYFCMKCAVERFIKSPKCYACGAATNGIFSKAERVLAKLEAKNRRRREERGLEEDNGDAGIEIGGASDDGGEGEDEDEEGVEGLEGGDEERGRAEESGSAGEGDE